MSCNAIIRVILLAMLVISYVPFSVVAAEAANASNAGWTSIFNGKNLDQWQGKNGASTGDWTVAGGASLASEDDRRLEVKPGTGILINGTPGQTDNLFAKREHGDVEVHVEFLIPKGSNSGVYFQGRYEIQILDSWGVESPKYGDCGGIYQLWKDNQGTGGHPPRVNASKPPGEWQAFEVVFRAPRFDSAGRKIENARFVKVVHNGQVIHTDAEVAGPTRSAAFDDEKPTGPIMLQGTHGPVAYRNLKIRAIELD